MEIISTLLVVFSLLKSLRGRFLTFRNPATKRARRIDKCSDAFKSCAKIRMARLPQLAIFFLAALHLLLFSICPASSRIYRTDDAVVIEIDDVTPSTLANRNYAISPPIPMMHAVNPYTGLYYQQQPNFPFWPYPLYRPASSFSNVENDTSTFPEYRQNIPCGVGPDSPPQRETPEVGIVGGSAAVPNSWPFVVGLRKSSAKGVFCGGSIISPTRILTAAHCVNELSAFDISTMTVSLGMHVQGILPNTNSDAQMTRRVTRVVYHPNYNTKTNYFDIAILTVAPAIVYSSAISPVCLPPFNNVVDQYEGQDAVVMGWGILRTNGPAPNALRQATLTVVTNDECNAVYGGAIKPQQFCAAASGKDSCRGDGGGPIVVQNSDGYWKQAGIVSYGNGCAKPGYPGVYANAAFFRNWINTYMNK